MTDERGSSGASPVPPAGHNHAAQLMHCLYQLARELHPDSPPPPGLGLDSSLDLDFAFDSLARVELLLRLEQTFTVSLSDQLLASAESPRDLLRALQSADRAGAERPTPVFEQATEPEPCDTVETPLRAQTLPEVLQWHAAQHPDRLHIRLYQDNDDGETISHRQLLDGAGRIAAGLLQQGLQPQQVVALMLPTGRDYFSCFFGILLAGAIPCALYPPARLNQLEDHLRRHLSILDNAGARLLITVPQARPFARLLRLQLAQPLQLVTPEQLDKTSSATTLPKVSSHQTAFLQYTSGSTGNPKGVILSHANLLNNVRGMGRAVAASSQDLFVSWLPLYHDMGLIGAWFGSLYHGAPLVIMSPLDFIARPRRWLEAIHRFRGTLSAAPNFGYEHCLRQLGSLDLDGLDLSSWRCAFNGAEAVSPATLEAFCQRFGRHGFRRQAMMPVYGLAENTVGLTFPPLQRGPRYDRIDRQRLLAEEVAEPLAGNSSEVLTLASCGRPMSGHQLRVVDSDDRELPDRRQGRVQFRGPSATAGYYRNPEQTRALFHGDWLESGDLGYIADGELFLTGRQKDLIIIAGRNIHPAELEQSISQLDGIRRGCVAVIGGHQRDSGTEQLVVLAESREQDEAQQQQLRRAINQLATEQIGMPADQVLLLPPRTLLKTSSGKLRRAACRQLYEQGELNRPAPQRWQLYGRLLGAGLRGQLRQLQRRSAEYAFAGYGWALFSLLALLTLPPFLLLPGKERRWALLRGAVKTLARLSATPVRLTGGERLPPPEQPCVFVCNHASYLDGFMLLGFLPRRVRFVAKGELKEKRLVAGLLSRLDAQFVERFDSRQGAEDAVRLTEQARRDAPLLYFAEGMLTRISGLLPFQLGAFVTAVQQELPVVPLAIRGSRGMMRADSWFPRRGQLLIAVGQPIEPPPAQPGRERDDWQRALKLRDQCRAAVLRLSGEADLRDERIRPSKPVDQ
ncbi:AMP-binding protein [Marinobacterium arenosum]|uniref:AMP-binding protein n=1 Tax=Marinobacterium arenosum TaxID=2862496 RepID=UPI001C93771F|nr:AMP-binding protein [Marinobacterium arenosum]MBY4677352.1 AMP-binding protein [Marinobacterium arenosum]